MIKLEYLKSIAQRSVFQTFQRSTPFIESPLLGIQADLQIAAFSN